MTLCSLQDSHACGEIVLGSADDGYYVSTDVPPKLSHLFAFMLHVPKRGGGGFPLLADSEDSKMRWMEVLSDVIANTSGTPDQSVAPVSYDEDNELYASIE